MRDAKTNMEKNEDKLKSQNTTKKEKERKTTKMTTNEKTRRNISFNEKSADTLSTFNIDQSQLYANAVIKKWGNSYGIRFPKVIVEALKVKEDDKIIMTMAGDSLLIKKEKESNYLIERLESFYNKPFDEIDFIDSEEEIDYGVPIGREIC